MTRRSLLALAFTAFLGGGARATGFEDSLNAASLDLEAQANHSILRSGFIPRESAQGTAIYQCPAPELVLAKETGSAPCEAVPPLPGLPPKSEAFVICTADQKALFGPFLILVTNSAVYSEAAVFPPLLGSLPPDVAAPLRTQWGEVESIKSALAGDGKELDEKDILLENDGKRLDSWRARIQARSSLIDEEVARYNAACAGRERTSECVAWRRRGIQCVETHNAEVGRFNLAVKDWNARRAEIISTGGAFKTKVKSWEDGKIRPFIAATTKALENAGFTRVRLQAQGDDIPSSGGVSRWIVQQRPVCLDQGLRALADVHPELSIRQRAARDQAFPKAERFMRGAAANGGVDGHKELKFQNEPSDPPNARIDITVFVGRAFVDCSAATSGGVEIR